MIKLEATLQAREALFFTNSILALREAPSVKLKTFSSRNGVKFLLEIFAKSIF